MARPNNSHPPIRFHSTSGNYCLYRDNRRILLGTDRAEAERRRMRLIAEWHGESTEINTDSGKLTVSEALVAYFEAVRGSMDQRAADRVCAAIQAATDRHGSMSAAAFRGRALAEVRAQLVRRKGKTGKPLTRRYINHLIDAMVLAFRWLVAHDYVPADNLARLREMSRELAEKGGGRESEPIGAVDEETILLTLTKCPPMLAAMIRLQRATGMRPGELLAMRRCDISTRPGELVPVAGLDKTVQAVAFDGRLVWLYCPARHKNLHRRKPRVIAIGDEAQRVLVPWLPAEPEALVFPNWTVAKYGNAVARACKRAGVKRWGVNRLRKSAAAAVDAAQGPDAAAAMLGHSASRRALDFYLVEQIEKAVATAAKAG